MSKPVDFLSQQQPTEFTVRALWYLHHFAQQGEWADGFAFEKQLRSCQLDYTLGSLHRIDHLLDQIRKLKPNPETFFRQPENQNFLFTLAFYCGELRGRLIKNAPVWHNWQSFIAEYHGMEKIFPNVVEYELVAHFRGKNEESTYFPLVAILERLFPKQEEPEKSVYSATIAGDYQQYDLNDKLPESPIQGLALNVQDALASTHPTELPYLQILPPQWMHGDDLMAQIRAMPTLYTKGRVVWAALVQANQQLFQHNDPASCPAEVIYDKSGRTPPRLLRQYAKELFGLKHSTPDDPELAQYVHHITDERTRFTGRIPTKISHMNLHGATVLIWRLHLPNAILTLPIFPIIVADDCDEVMLLPAKYWADTSFYRDWLREQAVLNDEQTFRLPEKNMLSSQEMVYAFRQYIQRHNDFWAGYTELLSPQRDELPQLGTKIIEQNQVIQYETDQGFLMRCRSVAQSEYRRWYEFSDHNQNGLPESVYQKLRDLNPDSFLSLLTEPFDVPKLANSQPLPKIAALMRQNQLSPIQIANMVQFLWAQGTISFAKVLDNESEHLSAINTTATLYLAFLYLTGKFVPQTIEEGASWLNLAVNLGDYRALHWVAELVMQIPELAPILFKKKLISEMSPLSIRLMNASSMGYLSYSISDVNAQESAYIHHPEAQAELARQYFQLAVELGDTSANARLNEWIAAKRLPEKAREQRFEHIQFWLMDYFAKQGVNIRQILGDLVAAENEADDITFHENSDNLAHITEDEDILRPESTVWKKWVIWSGVGVLMLGLVAWAVLPTDASNDPIASKEVSGSLKNTLPVVPTVPTLSASQPTVSLNQVMTELQTKLPLTFFTNTHKIQSIKLENGVVWLTLTDKSRGMMGVDAAQSLYCSEPQLADLRVTKTPVNFTVLAAQNVHYDVKDVGKNCLESQR